VFDVDFQGDEVLTRLVYGFVQLESFPFLLENLDLRPVHGVDTVWDSTPPYTWFERMVS
jgi:hypothetical protein